MSSVRLPDFIIGGAPRSGTTFLCHVLAQHERIHIPRPYAPEPKITVLPMERGSEGAAIADAYGKLFFAARADQLAVEKTSHCLESELALGRIARHLPFTKMIFILREPVSRAYSNWLRSRANGFEQMDFLEACLCERSREQPFGLEKSYVRPFDYLSRGFYDTHLERYHAALGRDRIHVALFEHLTGDWTGPMRSLGEFMGVDLLSGGLTYPGQINANQRSEKLDSAAERRLRALMAPRIGKLETLTGLDLSVWGY